MAQYVNLRDARFPLLPELWLTSSGDTPTYSWVVSCLHSKLDKDVGGHSLRSGGVTALASAAVNDDAIQSMGRWSSDTFRIYIRKHPVLLHALLHNESAFTTS